MSVTSTLSTFVPTQALTRYISWASNSDAAHVARSTANGTEPATPLSTTVLTGDQRTAQIPYPAEVSARARVGDDLHHGSECRSRDVGQRRRDHADDEQGHDRPANRARACRGCA